MSLLAFHTDNDIGSGKRRFGNRALNYFFSGVYEPGIALRCRATPPWAEMVEYAAAVFAEITHLQYVST